MPDFLDKTPYADAVARNICKATPLRAAMRGSCCRIGAPFLMNSPRQQDGPPIRDGKPYCVLVHLAEDITPFVAVAVRCARAGCPRRPSMPSTSIRASSSSKIWDDGCLGRRLPGAQMAELWGAAVDMLLAMATHHRRRSCRSKATRHTGSRHSMRSAMLTEAPLLIDWFWPARTAGRCRKPCVRTCRPLAPAARAMAVGSRQSVGFARLSLAELDVGARPARREARGHARLPGRATRPRCLRSCIAFQDARLDVPEPLEVTNFRSLLFRPKRESPQFSSDQFGVRSMQRLAPNVTRRSSASLRDWRNVTASAVISLISLGSPAILSAILRSDPCRVFAPCTRASSASAGAVALAVKAVDMTQAKTAMVLAAGYGERMRPLTLQHAEAARAACGALALDHVLDRLAGAGVETAVVNVHYLPDQLEASLARRKETKPAILVADERGVSSSIPAVVRSAPLQARPRPVLHPQCRHGVERGRERRRCRAC